MPIIPKTELVQAQGNAQFSRDRFIPDDFGMGKARALQGWGDTLIKGGAALSDIAGKLQAYNARMQDAEDEANLQKMQAIMYIDRREADKRRQENPGDYGQFEDEEHNRLNTLYNETLKPYYDKLSPRARERFDGRIYPVYSQDGIDAAWGIANQARVSIGQQQSRDNIDTYIASGEYDLAREALDGANRAGFFSPKDHDALKRGIDRAQATAGYVGELDAMNPRDALDALRSCGKDADGNIAPGTYANFKEFTPQERRAQEQRVIQRINENRQAYSDELLNAAADGRIITEEQFRQMAKDCNWKDDSPQMERIRQEQQRRSSAVNAATMSQLIDLQGASGKPQPRLPDAADEAKARKDAGGGDGAMPEQGAESGRPEEQRIDIGAIRKMEEEGRITRNDSWKLQAQLLRRQEADSRIRRSEDAGRERDLMDAMHYQIQCGGIDTVEKADDYRRRIIEGVDNGDIGKAAASQMLDTLNRLASQMHSKAKDNADVQLRAAACQSRNLRGDMPALKDEAAALWGIGTQKYAQFVSFVDRLATEDSYRKDNPLYEFCAQNFDDYDWEKSGILWGSNNMRDSEKALLRIQFEDNWRNGTFKTWKDYQSWRDATSETLAGIRGDQLDFFLMQGGHVTEDQMRQIKAKPQEEEYPEDEELKRRATEAGQWKKPKFLPMFRGAIPTSMP